MKKEDLKNRSNEELNSLLREKRDLLREFRFKIAKGRVKNVKEGRELRKTIARILTEINKRRLNIK